MLYLQLEFRVTFLPARMKVWLQCVSCSQRQQVIVVQSHLPHPSVDKTLPDVSISGQRDQVGELGEVGEVGEVDEVGEV